MIKGDFFPRVTRSQLPIEKFALDNNSSKLEVKRVDNESTYSQKKNKQLK